MPSGVNQPGVWLTCPFLVPVKTGYIVDGCAPAFYLVPLRARRVSLPQPLTLAPGTWKFELFQKFKPGNTGQNRFYGHKPDETDPLPLGTWNGAGLRPWQCHAEARRCGAGKGKMICASSPNPKSTIANPKFLAPLPTPHLRSSPNLRGTLPTQPAIRNPF